MPSRGCGDAPSAQVLLREYRRVRLEKLSETLGKVQAADPGFCRKVWETHGVPCGQPSPNTT